MSYTYIYSSEYNESFFYVQFEKDKEKYKIENK